MLPNGFRGKNVALNVHAEVAPHSAEAVKTCFLLQSVDVCSLLSDATSHSKQFFTIKSKEAPCIFILHVHPAFWKPIHYNNWVIEKRIGKLKGIIKEKIGIKLCSTEPL